MSPLTGIAVDELEPPPEAFAGFTPDPGSGCGNVLGSSLLILAPSFAGFTPDTGEGSTSGCDPKVPIPPDEGDDAGDFGVGDEDASPTVLGFFVADMTATKAGMIWLETAAEITSLVSDLALFPDSGFPDFNALSLL